MNLTISFEISGALPDSPVRQVSLPLEKQLEIVTARPKQPISIQTEAHKHTEPHQLISIQTETQKLPESPQMKLSTEVNKRER